MKTGFLLINLGTPLTPDVRDVRRYLNDFLMDRYVLDIPWPIRRLIVSAFILPFRPKKSAKAYASIWTPQGSPLLVNSQELTTQLQRRLQRPVALGMRYGSPSIADGVKQLQTQEIDNVVIVPLYPQYADSTVTTCVEAAIRALPKATDHAVVPPFYATPAHIGALTQVIRENLPVDFDHLLFSYHGLPERHLTRTDPTGRHCLQSETCCESASIAHATCYRHQVFETSALLAQALALDRDRYSISFQSRLGRLPWLTPYTDEVLAELPRRGVRHLAVACPAFVADNLETLEEIGIRGREIFTQAGGATFSLVPCLNSRPLWVEGLASLLSGYTTDASADTST